ncbi:hypothetical protein SDC9_180758 [bioreactor metagenome]|uniref:Uncharacterized protein n=1 Tax=bioreactor metagenome TaxID=1076179 RepID=A0A645HBU8_9ZZZZ
MDIRRKRHGSQLPDNLLKDAIIFKLNDSETALYLIFNLTLKLVPKDQTRTGHCLFSWLYHGFPSFIVQPFEQQQLDLAPGFFVFTKNPRRQHLCIIHN